MNRRLADRVVLVWARLLGSSLSIKKESEGAIDAVFNMNLSFNDPTQRPRTVDGMEAYEVSLRAELGVEENKEGGGKLFDVIAEVKGFFVVLGPDSISYDNIVQEKHTFVRLLFPYARIHMGELLSKAKLPEIPIAWDLGPRLSPDGSESAPPQRVAATGN